MKSIIGLLLVGVLALVTGCAGTEDGGAVGPETKAYTLDASEVRGGNCGALEATSMAFRAEDTGHTFSSDTTTAGYHEVVRVEWSEDSTTGKGVLYRSATNGNCTSFYDIALTPVAQ